jgi:hypothetical protein
MVFSKSPAGCFPDRIGCDPNRLQLRVKQKTTGVKVHRTLPVALDHREWKRNIGRVVFVLPLLKGLGH